MSQTERWNEAYRAGTLPWDSGTVCPHLEAFVQGRGGAALEIGCGTGTNAVFLAQRGFRVVALDLAPLAIERARARAAAAGVEVAFAVADVLRDPVAGGPFDLVFDRGVWHVFDEHADRERMAAVIAAQLAPGGVWLSIAGSTEGAPREFGPPRRSLRDIAAAIEPHLAIEDVHALAFGDGPDASDRAPAWRTVAAKRALPAQPSTRRT